MPLMVALRNRERRGYRGHAASARCIPTYVSMMRRSRSPHSGKGTTCVTHHNSISLMLGLHRAFTTAAAASRTMSSAGRNARDISERKTLAQMRNRKTRCVRRSGLGKIYLREEKERVPTSNKW